ncbi:hypothetical protein SELMODRAFT_424512 [Selaginella moellendorffii]|uniref:non-specific serine/threonine protein kinase n=1 Tax=Selaginella moellendorffii TaxID=88036 RepID=D8SQ48_SELML|nr:hypothetical protein SELMODRAFT_424512 [Selaginella moellendorffii]
MERFRFSLVLLGVTHLQLVSAVGYMSTLSAMWVSTVVSVGDYSVCSLQLPRLTAVCSSHWSPIVSEPPSDISFYALSGGGYFTCGLQQQTHFPICWGLNVSEEYRNVGYADLNSGGWHACAVKLGSDLVHCWGNNAFGQSQPPPYQDFWKVTAGDYFTCGLSRSSSKATCWGQITSSNVTVRDPGSTFENIYAGRAHVCGIERGVCTSNEETVCLACSQGPCTESGQTEIAPCNKTSDRVCDAVNTVVSPSKTGNKQTGPNIVGIVGGVLGGLAAVAAIAGVAGYICRRRAAGASTRGDDRWDDLANRVVAFSSVELQENRASDAVADLSVRYDFTSCGSGLLQQILQLALDCTKPRGRDRPSMSFVARKLEELFQLLPAQASRDEAGSSDSSTALRNSDTPLLSELSGAR